MANTAFQVLPYSIDRVIGLLSEKSRARADDIVRKAHTRYLREYFDQLGAKSIVVEPNYVDRDFLEDFSGYYVRCFIPYNRYCTRLHFFKRTLSKQQLDDALARKNSGSLIQSLQKAYLGFIVVKPLPQTPIGRTCLKTYPSDQDRRHFCTRTYKANLFGIPLEVETLAFQEQDTEAAACATSALWTLFHGTGVIFQHPIPSPLEITKAAAALGEHLTRTLPASEGLTSHQMAKAVRSLQLEPYFLSVDNEHTLKSVVYAYLRTKIPVLMNIGLTDVSKGDDHELIGYHAVAITGYSLGLSKPQSNGRVASQPFLLRASRIDKIYAHDDQIGPFSRMVFDGKTVWLKEDQKRGVEEGEYSSLSTSWIAGTNHSGYVRAVPDTLLIPLYQKIRIPYWVVEDAVWEFDLFITSLAAKVRSLAQKLEWDIYLTTVNDFKTDLLKGRKLNGNALRDILLEEMPHFIWLATAYSSTDPVLSLVFDATDMQQGNFLVRAIEYKPDAALFLRVISRDPRQEDYFRKSKQAWKIFEWFKKQSL